MESFTELDYIFFGLLAVSGIVGYVTGLAKELATLVAALGALGITFVVYKLFGGAFSEQLVPSNGGFDFSLLIYLAVAIASYIVLITIFSILIGNSIEAKSVSGADKILGLGIGILRGFAIGVLFAFFLDVFIARDRVPEFVGNSYVYPHLQKGSDILLRAYLPDTQNALDNAAEID